MAVPKKKTSKTKKAKRRYQWRVVAMKAAERSLSLSKIALKRKSEEQSSSENIA